jgi:hypothetical protein
MATTITFTDAIGAATLKNAKPVPGDRFANWVTMSKPIGDSANRQSDLALSMFRLTDSYGATFELTQIPVAAASGVRLVDVADRLIYWLLSGGSCAVNTGDVDGNAYASCGLMPGTTPALTMSDKRNLEYTLSLALVNLAGSPVRMVCHYAT